jgi:hypothetical protein
MYRTHDVPKPFFMRNLVRVSLEDYSGCILFKPVHVLQFQEETRQRQLDSKSNLLREQTELQICRNQLEETKTQLKLQNR